MNPSPVRTEQHPAGCNQLTPASAGPPTAAAGDAWSIGGKPADNRRAYLDVLRRMTPAARLAKAFELTAFARRLLLAGLRSQHPDWTDEQIHAQYLQRLAQCHNRNY